MAIETLEDAQHEVWAMRKDAEADFGEEVEIDQRDLVVSACFNIEDDAVALELCRVELGWVPRDLEKRLGTRDFLAD
jgi:hypothetical protein